MLSPPLHIIPPEKLQNYLRFSRDTEGLLKVSPGLPKVSPGLLKVSPGLLKVSPGLLSLCMGNTRL